MPRDARQLRDVKQCSGRCGQVKPVEMFDAQSKGDGRAAECKECRRRRQVKAGYAACRNRALQKLARRHRGEYERYREQARRELAPDSAPQHVWAQARARALRALSRRYRAERQQHDQKLRAAHPEWTSRKVALEAANEVRRVHREELRQLLSTHAGAKPAGQKLTFKLIRRAQRQLQLAHPEEYQALYEAERARIGNPVRRPARTRRGRGARST